MEIGDILFVFALVTLGLIFEGCSFGMYVDQLEEGSRLEAIYQKNRYMDVRSGMQYMDAKTDRSMDLPSSPQESPKKVWNYGWLK